MCSLDLNMGIISGTAHIETIFSFSPGTDKHCTGNALCSSDDSEKQLIHILHFFTIRSFSNCHKKNANMSNLENDGARESVLTFLSNDQETYCSERNEHGGKVRWCTM
jgi:hypothetical protein